MPDRDPASIEHLEQARDVLWEAMRMIEDSQRIQYRAGDCYVGEVWGDGVRAVLEISERITDLCGDLSAAHIEIGRMVKRDRARQ